MGDGKEEKYWKIRTEGDKQRAKKATRVGVKMQGECEERRREGDCG